MQQGSQNHAGILADSVFGSINKDFTIVGKHRVHSWYAWAIIGIVFGMALGIIYVANRSAQFDASSAATPPAPPVSIVTFGSDGNETYLIDKKKGKDVT